MSKFLDSLVTIAQQDVEGLVEARRLYGDSWRAEGGFSAFFNIKRKIDRFLKCLNRPFSTIVRDEKIGGLSGNFVRQQYDVFGHIEADIHEGGEASLDSIRDLRRYLMLAEAWMVEQKVALPRQRDNLSLDEKSTGATKVDFVVRTIAPF